MRLWYVQCVREWKMKQICAKAAFIEINGAKCYTNRTKWNNSHGDNAMAAQDYGDQDKAALDDSKLNPHKSASGTRSRAIEQLHRNGRKVDVT